MLYRTKCEGCGVIVATLLSSDNPWFTCPCCETVGFITVYPNSIEVFWNPAKTDALDSISGFKFCLAETL